MKRVPVVALLSALLMAPGVGLAQTEDHSQHAGAASSGVGTVSFETSCAPAVKAPFNHAVAELHSFWFPEARAGFEGVLKTDPLRDGVLGHRADALGQSVRRPALAADDRRRQGRDRQGPGHRIADAAREGLHRRRRRPVLERRRRHAARARGRLREGDRSRWPRRTRATSRRGSSGRSRSRRPRCRPTRRSRRTCARRRSSSRCTRRCRTTRGSRTTSSTPTTCRRWPTRRCRPRAPTPTSRRRCRTRSTCRRTRSRASALWKESVATNIKSAAEAEKTGGIGEALHALRLPDLRLPADGAWTRRPRRVLDHAVDGERRGAERSAGGAPAAPNTFALAAIPARYAMERQQWAEAMALTAAAGAEHAVHRSDHALRARDRRGARRQARRCRRRHRAARRDSRSRDRDEGRVLGRAGRHPAPRSPRRGSMFARASKDEGITLLRGGRRRRRPDRQVGRHAGPARAGARAARLHAARGRPRRKRRWRRSRR